MPKLLDPLGNFWGRVDKSGDCWIWQGHLTDDGYGRLKRNRRVQLAHRYIWGITNPDAERPVEVGHHCDTRACVRPEHLYPTTHLGNMQDAAKRNRMPKGERNSFGAHPEWINRVSRRDPVTGRWTGGDLMALEETRAG